LVVVGSDFVAPWNRFVVIKLLERRQPMPSDIVIVCVDILVIQ
jgi:hypothetical protein